MSDQWLSWPEQGRRYKALKEEIRAARRTNNERIAREYGAPPQNVMGPPAWYDVEFAYLRGYEDACLDDELPVPDPDVESAS